MYMYMYIMLHPSYLKILTYFSPYRNAWKSHHREYYEFENNIIIILYCTFSISTFYSHCSDCTLYILLCRTALQFLFKATERARFHNYYEGGLSHTWMTFYLAQRTDDGVILNEWLLLYLYACL